jgi:hypothetical protein
MSQASQSIPIEEGFAHIEWTEFALIGFVLLAAAVVWFFPQFSAIGIVAALIGGYPIYREAIVSTLDPARVFW